MFEALPAGDAAAPAPAPAWISMTGQSEGFVGDRRFGAPGRRQGDHEPSEAEGLDAALAEARAQGEAEGRAQAEREFAEREQAYGQLRGALTRLDRTASETLSARLGETVALLCERTLQPLALDGELLARRCQRAAAMLAEETDRLTLRLNPADIPALDESFAARMRIEADTELERGSLRLDGLDGSVLDGPEQWREAIAEALDFGGE